MSNVSCIRHNQRVSEIMTPHVQTVSQNATMTEAAEMLVQHRISGLPVVDEMGKCVGVLSNADLVRRCWQNSICGDVPISGSEAVVFEGGPSSPLHVEQTPEDRVARYMSPAVQTIAPDCPVVEAARFMTAGGIHRLIVVDHSACPVGIVSALDVLRAVANSDENENDS